MSASEAIYRFTYGFLVYFVHAFLREPFNASTESWERAQASASKMDQTQKSIVFNKSGDEGGQTFAPEMRKIVLN